MNEATMQEIRDVERSYRQDMERAENLRSTPEQESAKSEALHAAFSCLLAALMQDE